MTAMNNLGAEDAHTIRVLAAHLAETDNLRDTSDLGEILLDLSFALASLAGPIGALVDEVAERTGGDFPDAMPNPDDLEAFAAKVKHAAKNV